jgi:hypothetical protein
MKTSGDHFTQSPFWLAFSLLCRPYRFDRWLLVNYHLPFDDRAKIRQYPSMIAQ